MAKKNINQNEDISFENQTIVDVDMGDRFKTAFMEYSMSVLVDRALPDVRDGMKPGQRRIMYAMYEDGLVHSNPFRKSATTVGNVLGRYHPHGDAAVYGTMVRLAQDFSLRYPLIEGHGNFGSIDGDGAAAYRYTEARMSRIADELMRDLDKDVVDFMPNFDNSRKEPTVLPSRFPNLLVNGTIGIAVGMASNIPPHNLTEVIDGTLYYMDNPDATLPELMKFIKGPDFPTSAMIYGTAGIYEAYATGRGRVTMRSRAEVDEEHHRIIVSEIPYQVNKSTMIEAMADKVKSKVIEGITDIRDESDMKKGIRIVIEYRRDANGHVILNQLYKYTQLQDTCAMNMVALVKGEPKQIGLKEILRNYIEFQEEVIVRRTRFELDKAEKEAHIFEGYKIAIDNIDEVIKLIRASADIPSAKAALMERFGLSDAQAQAIVSMPLGRLSGMEREKIEARLRELYAKIEELKGILADENKVKAIIRDEMTRIRDKFGDERKTEIVEAQDEIMLEDLIEKHTCVLTMTDAGYIKRQHASDYTAQRRGGKGIIGMGTKEEDYITRVVVANSHEHLMFFTNLGRVYCKKAYQIPESSRTAKGTNIVNILELMEGEKISAIVPVPSLTFDGHIVMVTRCGVIKKTAMTEFEYQRRGGKIAITLDEGDELMFCDLAKIGDDIIIATKDGVAARFDLSKVSSTGRTSRGVRGIRLKGDNAVCGAAIIRSDEEWQKTHRIVTITTRGFGKRMDIDLFDAKGRGIQGVICHKLSDKTGELCGMDMVAEDDDLMLMTDEGIIIRTPAAGIPEYGRGASGVIVMRIAEGASLVNFAISPAGEDVPENESAESETVENAADTEEDSNE
ncbi:MAG: DNA gyrase subunit A [Ruminococcaceae bacterium]|nr:DNA gyrase subunit A [Oscillospiraceae bacterium]